MNMNADEEAREDILFGSFDPKHFKGEHQYTPITRKGYWHVCYRIMLLFHV